MPRHAPCSSRPASGPPHRRALRGFTLFELVMVVMIIGIASAVVVLAVNGDIHSARLKIAANVLADDIEFAEGECINQPNTPRGILFDTNNNKYSVIDIASNQVIAYPGDGLPYTNDFATGRNAQLAGVALTSVLQSSTSLPLLTFDTYGRPKLTTATPADITITLTYNGSTMKVIVNHTTGDVSIQ